MARRAGAIVAVVLTLAGVLLNVGVQPASAAVGMGVVADFPDNVIVGQTGIPVAYSITNVSNGSDADDPTDLIRLDSILLVPSCPNLDPNCAGGADPGVFALSSTGVGESGTVCAGKVFNITVVNATTGQVSFTAANGIPVVLQPPGSPGGGDTCRIDFTANVVKRPTIDARPLAGIQTNENAFVLGTNLSNGSTGGGFGTDFSTVAAAAPSIATLARSSNPLAPPGTAVTGETVSDTATVTGVVGAPAPTGNVTFTRFFDAPGAAPCSGPSASETVALTAGPAPAPGTPPTSTAATTAFTPTGPGTVRYQASYGGDANYNALAATACGAAGENVTVQAQPTIATTATSSNPAAPPGTATTSDTVTDTATVTGSTGGPVPTGTVTFTRFVDAAGAAPCSGPATVIGPVPLVATAPAPNPPTATASTPPFSPTGPGTVRFVASYSGDPNYTALPNTPCGAAGENVTVQAQPTIATTATSSNPAAPPGTATTGETITDTATVTGSTGGPAPTGTVTFTRFVDAPGAAPCSGPAAVIGPVPLVPTAPAPNPPTATASTPAFTPAGPGTVRFVASYSGDPNYTALPNTACGAAGENIMVRAPASLATLARSSNPAAAPGTAVAPETVTDTATVTGAVGGPAPTGSITFTRFFDAPGAAPCSSAGTVETVTLTAGPAPAPGAPPTSTATTAAFTTPGPGTVRYVASYGGDGNYSPVPATACGAAGENVTVQAQPSLATLARSANPAAAPGTASIGDNVTDTATVTGSVGSPAPTGNVTFTRFTDPIGAAPCSGTSTTETVALTPGPAPAPGAPSTATATTAAFSPTGPGTIRYVASYGGDANYTALPNSACGAAGENLTVLAPPGIVTTATATPTNPAVPAGGARPGQNVADVATVTGVNGGPVPTGTVTFTRFFDPPGAAPCSSAPTVLGPVTLAPASPATTPPSATATSPSVVAPSTPGTFRFIASYSGDGTYAALPATPCNAPGENLTMQLPPSIVTQVTPASGTATPGQNVSDSATVTGATGGAAPTGTVTFTRFFDAPGTAPCSGPNVVIGPVGLTPVAPATNPPTSTASTPTVAASGPGTFRYIVSYSGDANYSPLPNTACGEANESVNVPFTNPQISTTASAAVPAGGQINDVAHLSGGNSPTGSIIFNLYGPGDATCSGAVAFTSTVAVSGNGDYNSGNFTANQPGVYRFRARYTGDANNTPAPNLPAPNDFTACNDPAEQVPVGLRPTNLVTAASAPVSLGQPISDTATLSGGVDPTGTIIFDLFGPDNATCAPPPVFSATVNVDRGNATYASPQFTPAIAGTYRWVARYSGDTNDAPSFTACNDPGEAVVVSPLPAIALVKTATPTTMVVPGGTFTFNLLVTNTGPVPLTITSLVDDIYGDVTKIPGSTCNTAIGTVLAASPGPGNTYSCHFPGDFRSNTPAAQTDTATVRGVDVRGNVVTATAQATVNLTPLPTIAITKAALPTSLPVPGGTFLFNLVVTNTSNVPLTITSLRDNVYGDVTTIPGGNCNTAIGTVLAPAPGPGNTYSCRFPGDFRGPSGASQTDTVTVNAVDQRGNTVTASANATVTITPLPPAISVIKTPNPTSLPEPGGEFTFTVQVTNTGPEAVTITSLTDDVYGNLNGRGTCAIGATLAPGASYTCSFKGNFFGAGGASQTDTVTSTAVDTRGNTVTANAKATVTITPVPPTIAIVKTATPPSRVEPGGTFTFGVTVTNPGVKPVRITSLVDNVYGDLNGRGTCAVGAELAANGGTYTCSFQGDFRGPAGASQTDTVTVRGVDRQGNEVTASAKATVTITPLPPVVVVTTPPTPAPVVVVTTPPAPAPTVLVRTGSNTIGAARMALLFLLAGLLMLLATRRPAVAGLGPAPLGPGRGPGGPPSWLTRTPPPRPAGPVGGRGVLAPPAPRALPAPPPAPPALRPTVLPAPRVLPPPVDRGQDASQPAPRPFVRPAPPVGRALSGAAADAYQAMESGGPARTVARAPQASRRQRVFAGIGVLGAIWARAAGRSRRFGGR